MAHKYQKHGRVIGELRSLKSFPKNVYKFNEELGKVDSVLDFTLRTVLFYRYVVMPITTT